MTKEPNKPANLNKVNMSFHDFISSKINEVNMEPNQEILEILLARENWETEETEYIETPAELAQRVQNWVAYDPEQDRPKLTRRQQLQYEFQYGLKNAQLRIVKSIYKFSIFQALLGNQYDNFVKISSRGRATTVIEAIQWNAQYWPQHLKYFGLSRLFNYLSANLDYRRVFQLGVFSLTAGAGFVRFFYIENSTKNQLTHLISAQNFNVEPKSDLAQRLLIKNKFGKVAAYITDKPLIKNFDYLDLTEIQPTNDTVKDISKYPFIGNQVKTTARWKNPTVPNLEAMFSVKNPEFEAIKFAAQLTTEHQLKNVLASQKLTLENFYQPSILKETDSDLNFEDLETEDTNSTNGVKSLIYSEGLKKFAPDRVGINPGPNWEVLTPQVQFPNLELKDVLPSFDSEATEIKSTQLKKAFEDVRLENVIWKYASGVDSSNNNAESLENLDEIGVEDVEHEEDVYEMYTQILKTENENELSQFFGNVSMEERELNAEDSEITNSDLKKIGENVTVEQFSNLTLVNVLLPSLFVWYAAYNLYQFRLHFIFNVRTKPAPVLYTRFDHLGRLPGKVKLNDVVGIDGGSETIEKLFAALQRARGMGIFMPTVIHTVWESTLSPLIPGQVDAWVMAQRNKVKEKLVGAKKGPVNYLTPELSLAETVLMTNEQKHGYEPRFNFLKNAINSLQLKANEFETKDLQNLAKLNSKLQQQESKLHSIKQLKNIPLNFTVKNIVKFSLYALQLIETELSNAPIIAALKPGRYGLHNLPKGMLLVGEPGNGRSFLARAIASETRLPFFKSESTRFIDPKFGVIRLMSLFRRVRNQAPGVLFIRDIDLMTVDREKTTSPELIQLTTQFLICFDGYYIGSETRPTQRKIFTLGSVSDLSRMDPACLRSGRFEWVVNLRNPILGEREFLLMTGAEKTPVQISDQIAWNYFGRMSEGFTNAEVVSIINSSTLQAIHNGSFCHTNESLNEGLSKLFQLQLNKKIGNTVEEGFFNNLHTDELTKPQDLTFNTFGERQQIPFKTKCVHLLTSVKNWSTPNPKINSSALTMQNIGMAIQPVTVDYSQLLISELLDFMAEGVFVKQLQRCSPRHSFVTQTSYCESLTHHLNKNFAKGCMNYQMEGLTVNYGKATDKIKCLNRTNNWETLNYSSFKKLQHRTKLMRKWYKARTSCALIPNSRVGTNRFGYAMQSTLGKSKSMERFKTRIKNRLLELTKSDRSKYSAITTIRGTYGTAGFQTRLQRPVTGPVTQISKEFLEIEFK